MKISKSKRITEIVVACKNDFRVLERLATVTAREGVPFDLSRAQFIDFGDGFVLAIIPPPTPFVGSFVYLFLQFSSGFERIEAFDVVASTDRMFYSAVIAFFKRFHVSPFPSFGFNGGFVGSKAFTRRRLSKVAAR